MIFARPAGLPFFLLWAATVLLLSAAPPAFAQDGASPGPTDSQYDEVTAAGVNDVPPTLTENVDDGTGPVNEAMTDEGLPAAAASAPPSETPTPTPPPEASALAPPSAASPPAGPAVEDLEVLPETGGPSPPALCAGVLLLASGVLLPVFATRMFPQNSRPPTAKG